MGRTKQTPRGGSSSHRPAGMTTATFAGTQKEAEEQFADVPEEDSQEMSDPDKLFSSKQTGKASDQPQQAEGEADAPPKETLQQPVSPPTDPQLGSSKDPTDPPPTDPTVDPAAQAEVEPPPELTAYVRSYKQAGKTWLDTVLTQKEQAYNTLYDSLSWIGAPHKEHLDKTVRKQVFASIRDMSGNCLSEDAFAMYVDKADPPQKQRFRLTSDEAKEALKDYYDTINTLSQAQANLAQSTKVLESKIEDKSVFQDIIRQTQLPSVQVSIRTVQEEEKLQDMMYREVTLRRHLPNFRRLSPNANEQTKTLAAFMYFVLYEQITGLPASQTGLATKFGCQTTPFKRLVTGKKQPGGKGRGKPTLSKRDIAAVAAMEGGVPPKRTRTMTAATPKPTQPPKGKGRGKGRGKN